MALNSQQLAMEIVAKDLATATLQRVNANVENFTRTAARAERGSFQFGEGLKKAANAVNGLAGDMLGLNSKVGRMAEGLLAFAGGGALVTAVALGITAVGAAVKLLRVEVESSTKATDELAKSWSATFDQIASKTLGGLEAQRAQIQARFTFHSTQYLTNRTKEVQDQLAEDSKALQAINGAIEELRRKMAEDAAKRAAARRLETPEGPGLPAKITGPGLEPLAPLAAFPPGTIEALTEEFKPLNEAVMQTAHSFSYWQGVMETVAQATTGIGEGLIGLGEVVGGRFGDTARKIIAPFAKIEGTYYIIKGLAKIADSLFPPNPAGLVSGSGMIARGRQLVSLAGGGASYGGAAGGGGAGGLGPGQQTIAQQQGEVNVQLKKGYVDSTDPDFQDFLVETLRGAGNRRVTVTYV